MSSFAWMPQHEASLLRATWERAAGSEPEEELALWEDREPLPLSSERALPSFPVDALPSVVADMVTAVSRATQTDPGMVASVALGSLAACAGGRAVIEIRLGWREPLNLFVISVAGPGERKSAVLQRMTSPLQAAERALVEEVHAARVEAQTTRDVAMKAADTAMARAGKADDLERDELTARARDLALAAQALEVPPLPRLLADDVTPEACASLLAEQEGRLTVISAEGGIFDIIAGRYSNSVPALDVWLKGHSGDPLRVDRKGREPEYVENPALTLCLMVQPDVLKGLARQGAFRGRGLLARFLYAIPESRLGRREINPEPVPAEVQRAYADLIEGLARGLAGWHDPAVLLVDEAAARLVIDLESTIEPQLNEAGALGHIADWGSKHVGAVMRIAGLLHLARHPEDGFRRPVAADTVARSIRVGEYYRAHALVAFDEMKTDPLINAAEYLLGVIRRQGTRTVSRRDLHRASSRSRFPRAGDLDPVIRLLEEHGYLRPLPSAGPRHGRPRSPRWEVHPSLRTP